MINKKVLFVFPKEDNQKKSGGSFRRDQNKELFRKYFSKVDSLEIVLRSLPQKWYTFRQQCKKYDILVLEEPKYIFLLLGLKTCIIYSSHNFEAKLRFDFFKQNISFSSFLRFVIFSLSEHIALKVSDIIFTISSTLSEQLQKYTKKQIISIPPKPLISHIQNECRIDTSEQLFLFVGSFSWLPNKQAYDFFIEEVLPFLDVRKRKKFLFVGNGNDSISSFNMGEISVDTVGYVENLGQFYAESYAIIIPIVSGSGVKIKLIEALVNKKPIVSMQKGIEGFEHLSNLLKPVLSAEGFSNELINLEKEEYYRRRIEDVEKTAQVIFQEAEEGEQKLYTKIEQCLNLKK